MSFLWSYFWTADGQSTGLTSEAINNVTLRDTGRMAELLAGGPGGPSGPPVPSPPDGPVGPLPMYRPARFLPKALEGKKLNSETLPESSILITQKQLNEVSLKKAPVMKRPKYFINRNEVMVEFCAAGMIRLAKEYKKKTSSWLISGIEERFAETSYDAVVM